MKNVSVFFLFTLAAVIAGCAGNEEEVTSTTEPVATSTPETTAEASPAVATDNKNCPIMGHAVTKEGGTTTWNGKTIGFCCEGCLPKFEELSDEDKAAKLAAADKADHKEGEEAEASGTTEES